MRIKLYRFVVVIVLAMVFPLKASAEFQQEFLLFLSAEGANKLLGANKSIRSPDGVLAADVMYSMSWNRFKFLGEYLASNKETEMERLQLGAQIGDKNYIWVGRFHAPGSYWTSEYHHGQYLQVSISNPGIAQFEDFGGILPTHSTGLLLDGAHVFDNSTGIKSAFSVGTAPVLGDLFLENFDVLSPRAGHDLAYNLRFTYFPSYFEDSKIGIAASIADINVEDRFLNGQKINDINQYSISSFVDWNWEGWHLFSVVSYLNNRLNGNRNVVKDSFVSGFLQTEYEFDENWTIFGRIEASISADDSPYLELIPNFVKSRQMLGGRFDFWTQHALTLEVANVETVNENFGQVRLQWSAVFP